ncbi:MAG: hypothetical protein KGL91_07720 [Xanthomonadaceae bacterium]|nr:hypothetical protein [Xanthomonadaceae bacterium]
MSLSSELARVRQAEQSAVAARTQAGAQWQALAARWRASWTPGRIIVIGLTAGLVVGQARPLRLAGNAAWPLLRSLAPLLGDAITMLARPATPPPTDVPNPGTPDADA